MKKLTKLLTIMSLSFLLCSCMNISGGNGGNNNETKEFFIDIQSHEVVVGSTFEIKIKDGETYLEEAKFTSSDETIISINDKGVGTALKIGTSTITISKSGYTTTNISITVIEDVTLLEMEVILNTSIEVDGTTTIVAKDGEKVLTDLTYVSSDPSILTVSNIGVVTGIKTGKASVTISKTGYKDKVYDIEVLDKPLDPPTNPYLDIDTAEEKVEFYSNNYKVAHSYKDAQYRSEAHLLSGTNEDSNYLPTLNNKVDTTKINNYRSNTFDYILDSSNNKIAYKYYQLDGSYIPIYKGGAYYTMNEVAAYLLGFGEVPVNHYYDKGSNGKASALNEWGRYARVNYGAFSGPSLGSYQFEPYMVGMENKDVYYTETDFGNDVYYNKESYVKGTKPYINSDATSITRGVLRFIFTSTYENSNNSNYTNNKYYNRVYYTYNHYNDYYEFLNYQDGWSNVFGNMTTRGNAYGKYNSSDPILDAPIPNESSIEDIITKFKA